MNSFFSKLSNSSIFIFIFIFFSLKIIFYVLVQANLIPAGLGGGSDADYYHTYAIGMTDMAVNIWPVILRFFNEMGLYSREYFSFILFLLNLIIIPLFSAKISGLDFKTNQKQYLILVLICTLYPTLFFYSLDIYRDVFMVFLFLLGAFFVKQALKTNELLVFLGLYVFSVIIGLFLLQLRPYLGYAFLLSLIAWKIKFTKKRLIVYGFLYFIALFLANLLGLLESLTEYRSGFEEAGGGSTLGLNFSNPVMFLPNFILSILGQLFGLYITNPIALLLLIIETLPFMFMLSYIIKNIRDLDGFGRFLIIFFVLYASVWLIGNDNLGTAVRLRLYNYLAVYICFFYILRLKEKMEYQQVIIK